MKTYDRNNYINYILIAANILYFVFLSLQGRTEYDMDMMLRFGAMYEPLVLEKHEYYRFLTACFMHFGIEHLVSNMLVLFVVGGNLERALGHVKYLLFYLLAGLGANVISFFWHLQTAEFVISAGASGAVFGVVGGLLFAIVRNRGRLEDLSLRQMLVMIVLSVYLGMSEGNVDNAAHIGGLVCGFLLAAVLYRPVRGSGFSNVQSSV